MSSKFCKDCKTNKGIFVELEQIDDDRLKCPKCGRIVLISDVVSASIFLEAVKPDILKQIDDHLIEYIKGQLKDPTSILYNLVSDLLNPKNPSLETILKSASFWKSLKGMEIPEKFIKTILEKVIEQRKAEFEDTIEHTKFEILESELKPFLKIQEKLLKDATKSAIMDLKDDPQLGPLVKNIGIAAKIIKPPK